MATEKELRLKAASTATSYLGCKTGDAKHKKLIDTFNKISGIDFKMNYTAAWCAASFCAWFKEAGLIKIMPSSANCGTLRDKNIKAGQWVENDAYKPSIGDGIIYNWDDSGVGDNTGSADHVGMVTKVYSHGFEVTEGNKNGACATRTMSFNGRYIRGFITPKYSSLALTSASDTGTSSSKISKTVKCNGTVTASKLNVRVWAGTEYKVWSFGQLSKGTVVQICNDGKTIKAADGTAWNYICYNNHYGFVSASYIKIETNNTSKKVEFARSYSLSYNKEYTVNVKDDLKLRYGPGTKYGIIASLKNGTKVRCFGYYTGEWLLVKAGEQIGYVYRSYLK